MRILQLVVHVFVTVWSQEFVEGPHFSSLFFYICGRAVLDASPPLPLFVGQAHQLDKLLNPRRGEVVCWAACSFETVEVLLPNHGGFLLSLVQDVRANCFDDFAWHFGDVGVTSVSVAQSKGINNRLGLDESFDSCA